ncbi:hypothetical protein [Cohnella sp.]|uniref:hypothetical protein n=1 Tax=Cohnella sp. TaxID=1883426 RepID=UPI00370375C5
MSRSKTLRRHIFRECDFSFDFAGIKREWTINRVVEAIDLGRPFDEICRYLLLDSKELARLAKHYALQALGEQLRQLTVKQVELMNQYYDHTVCGYTLGELLEQTMYLDPQAWVQAFENSILYLQDRGLGNKTDGSSSSLSQDQQEQVVERLFGQIPLSFDQDERADQEWCAQGSKSAAVFRFFSRFLKHDQFLRPHPNDVLSGNRRARMLEQYDDFRTIAKDSAARQSITEDLRRYESELHIAYVHYTSAKIDACGLLNAPETKRKGEAIVKLTALMTLVKSPQIRLILFDNLVPGPDTLPFNFDIENMIPDIAYPDMETEMDDLYELREGRASLYLSLIFTIEVALKAYVKDKLREAVSYFGHSTIDPTQAVDPEDEAELLQLKERLALIVLLQSGETAGDAASLLTSLPYATNASPYPAAADRTFAAVYRVIYDTNKAYAKEGLFRDAWKQWARSGCHRRIHSASLWVEKFGDFEDAFKQFARIKSEDLGNYDIEKLIREI